MCTVTFWPNTNGYRLGMNRDEKHARPKSMPPELRRAGTRTAIWPMDPAGGTWVGLNDAGAAFALVNWYSVPSLPLPAPITRGLVVTRLLAVGDPDEAVVEVSRLPLAHLQPFRLASIFPDARTVVEWRWNGARLERLELPWSPCQWISSGLDEPIAQRIRGATFGQRSKDPDAGSADWLSRLHASHEPVRGAFSNCVHREDAGTVSYTEIEWSDGAGVLRCAEGCPCGRTSLGQGLAFPSPRCVRNSLKELRSASLR